MPYLKDANADTPAFIVYLIDLSASMGQPCGDGGERRRIDVVANALERTRRTMIARSRRGANVRPRYAVAMLGYSNSVVDLLGGIKTIDQLETISLPSLNPDPQGYTNTKAAFEAALGLVQQYLPNLQDCPAPLVCHLTDGGANMGGDPTPMAAQVKGLYNADGNVLVENIYIGTQLLKQPIRDAENWPGVLNPSDIREPYVQALWHMASPLPESYSAMMNETAGYQMKAGAQMLIPAETPDMIELAFVMSGSTPITAAS